MTFSTILDSSVENAKIIEAFSKIKNGGSLAVFVDGVRSLSRAHLFEGSNGGNPLFPFF